MALDVVSWKSPSFFIIIYALKIVFIVALLT